MKKVLVTTYCEPGSYGSMLQAHAFQTFLGQMGYEGYVMPPYPIQSSAKECIYKKEKRMKHLPLNLHYFLHRRELCRRYTGTLEFMHKHIRIAPHISFEKLKHSEPEYDAYITGSDQVWHPGLMNPFFFLDFLPKDVKRISYAASMGSLSLNSERKKALEKYLSDFYAISVREKDNALLLDKIVDVDIHTHIDPVFLLNAEYWRGISKVYNINRPYILVYALYWDPVYNLQLEKLSNESGIQIIAICKGYSKVYANKKIYDADLQQFIWLFDHAEAVISSSFHGVAMSILLGKRFSAVINPNMPSRISSLLELLGVENVPISQLLSSDGVCGDSIHSRIEEERTKSFNYLKGVLP